MNKEFQLGALRIFAKNYPSSVVFHPYGDKKPLEEEFFDLVQQYKPNVRANLMVLQELGYLEVKYIGCDLDACRITAQWLVAAGADILHPDPNAELVKAIRELTEAVQSLKPKTE